MGGARWVGCRWWELVLATFYARIWCYFWVARVVGGGFVFNLFLWWMGRIKSSKVTLGHIIALFGL